MRLFKLLAILVILCLIAIFIFENMKTWVQPVNFKLDLYFNRQHNTAGVELYLVILLSAMGGFIVGLAALLNPYLRVRRQIKREQV